MIYRYKDIAFSKKKEVAILKLLFYPTCLLHCFTVWCPECYRHDDYSNSIEHDFIENQVSYFPLYAVDFSFHHTVSFEV